MRSDTFFRERVGIEQVTHTEQTKINATVTSLTSGTHSLLSHQMCAKNTLHSYLLCNEYYLHEADTIQSSGSHAKKERRQNSKLYVLENATQLWVILQLHYSLQAQDFFLQKAKHMRKAEEEEERLVNFQVQFQFLDLCLRFTWNSSTVGLEVARILTHKQVLRSAPDPPVHSTCQGAEPKVPAGL